MDLSDEFLDVEDDEMDRLVEAAQNSIKMKRNSAKILIERYFFQLQRGCGFSDCKNINCASSSGFLELSPNKAAIKAVKLYAEGAALCGTHPSEMAKTTEIANNTPEVIRPTTSAAETSENLCSPNRKEFDFLDENIVEHLIAVCREENSPTKLIRTIGTVVSTMHLLSQSFFKTATPNTDAEQCSSDLNLSLLKKEDLRTLQGETDKDVDSSTDKNEEPQEPKTSSDTKVDLPSLRRAFKKILDFDNSIVNESINTALRSLYLMITADMPFYNESTLEEVIHCFIISFEIFALKGLRSSSEPMVFGCIAIAMLPCWCQARLARIWAESCKPTMGDIIDCVQEVISTEVISRYYSLPSNLTSLQNNQIIVSATKVLKILYYSSILAGINDIPSSINLDSIVVPNVLDPDNIFPDHIYMAPRPAIAEEKLAKELGICVIDSRIPYIPYEDFYNEPLNDTIEMDSDYLNYKKIPWSLEESTECFSFMLYSFILTPATKVVALYYDSRIRMFSERQTQMMNQLMSDSQSPSNPFLKLKVHRDNIIDDSLIELEMIALSSPKDFKKQLVVEFIGEQGIDAGGISKEFFQLVVEEIFNPDFGMFIFNDETKTVWFNSSSFENDAEFTLIGIVLGLAIYNNIILAVKFPMVVYKKLMDGLGTYYDLEDWNPLIYRSLKSMLEYEDDDMEEVFIQTFQISYNDVFGNILDYELKPNGKDILVNQSNKHEFVLMYSDFLLNKVIERQFKAFKKGFLMVTDESPLKLLFRPEEIELLVCGCQKFDFHELEKSAEYDSGYTAESKIITDFWSVVHSMPMESKKKLLEFTTGSDRVPVGGLSNLKLIISRNGSDSDRLPTSHTCFNVLLLPEYDSREKLEERLLKAINYSKGFGLI